MFRPPKTPPSVENDKGGASTGWLGAQHRERPRAKANGVDDGGRGASRLSAHLLRLQALDAGLGLLLPHQDERPAILIKDERHPGGQTARGRGKQRTRLCPLAAENGEGRTASAIASTPVFSGLGRRATVPGMLPVTRSIGQHNGTRAGRPRSAAASLSSMLHRRQSALSLEQPPRPPCRAAAACAGRACPAPTMHSPRQFHSLASPAGALCGGHGAPSNTAGPL